jgi:hypothetical protein
VVTTSLQIVGISITGFNQVPIVHGCGKVNLTLVIYDHHGASPVLKSVSVQGESTTLSSVTSTWAKASDFTQKKVGKSIERHF